MANFNTSQPPAYGVPAFTPSIPPPMFPSINSQQGPQAGVPATNASFQQNANIAPEHLQAIAAHPQFAPFFSQMQANGHPPFPFPPPPPPPLLNGYPFPPIPPPPFGGVGNNNNQPPQPLPTSNTGAVQTNPIPHQSASQIPIQQRISDLADIDREDGEVSEGDHPILPKPTFPVASPPKSVPATRLSTVPNSNVSESNAPPISPMKADLVGAGSQHTYLEKDAFSEKERAKAFIALLNQHKIGFSALVEEGLDAEILRGFYRELGIPVPVSSSTILKAAEAVASTSPKPNISQIAPSGPAAPMKTAPQTSRSEQLAGHSNNTAPPASTIAQSTTLPPKPTAPSRPGSYEKPSPGLPAKPTNETSASPSAGTARQAAAKPASQPANREEYIARLMAAKSAKTGNAAKPTDKPIQQGPALAATPAVMDPKPQTVPKPVESLSQPDSAKQTPPVPSVPPTGPKVLPKVPSSTREQPSNAPPTMPKADLQKQDEAARQAAEKKRLQTELARRRIEALAAARANKSNAASKQPTPSSTPAPAPPPSVPAPADPQKIEQVPTPTVPASPKSETSFYDDESGVEAQSARDMSRPKSTSSGLLSSSGSPSGSLQPQPPNEPPKPAQRDGPIPGLFLTHTTVSPAPVAKGRKRPVASDFDMDVPHPTQSTKRPFGNPKHSYSQERIVIQVSDDESEGSAMDIDDDDEEDEDERNDNDALYGMSRSSQKSDEPKTKSFGDMPPLRDFSSRPGFSRMASLPRSFANTPSASQTPQGAAGPQKLSEKEKQILDLKRRIKEMESKATAKRLAQTPNTSKPSTPYSTPMVFATEANLEKTPSNPTVSTPAKSSQAQSVTQTMTPEWRRKRRAEIRSSLPALEVNVETTTAKLEKLQMEMQQLQKEKEKQLEDKARLTKELEELGIDTDGIPDEELQETRDQAVAAQQTAEVNKEATTSLLQPPTDLKDQKAQQTRANDPENVLAQGNNKAASQEETPATATSKNVRDNETPAHSSDISGDEMDFSPYDSESGDAEEPTAPVSIPALPLTPSGQPAVSSTSSGTGTPEPDQEDFYSPGPVDKEEEQGKVDADTAVSQEGDEESSGDEEHSNHSDDAMSVQSAEYDPSSLESTAPPMAEQEVEEEDYDPSSVGLETTASEVSSSNTGTRQSSAAYVPEPRSEPTTAGNKPLVADDLAPELQGPAHQFYSIVEETNPQLPAPQVPSVAVPRYEPYESPLRFFKSYRYHPNYANEVPGGFRSMTYSHQIDPELPMCPYESTGGVCNDGRCPYQHFRKIGLSDDMILVQLGTVNPGTNDEERAQWTTGLRNLLQNLRKNNIKDRDEVATAITKYRREFLKDPTRILNL